MLFALTKVTPQINDLTPDFGRFMASKEIVSMFFKNGTRFISSTFRLKHASPHETT
jgi:hypothetical protein